MSVFRQLMMRRFHSAKNYINFKKMGSLTINDGVCSGFSSSNWLESENTISLGSNFEIVVKFTLGSLSTNQYVMSGKTNQLFNINYESLYSKITYNLGTGSSWILDTKQTPGLISVTANTIYYVKFGYDGSKYTSYLSTDGINWTLDWQYTTSSIIIPTCTIVIGVARSITYPILGNIYINETYIKLNDVKYYIQII